MLFNSYEFLFVFLPLTASVFFFLSGRGMARAAAAWLALASLVFYGYWNPRYVALLLASIAANFAASYAMLWFRAAGRFLLAKRMLVFAVIFNLGLLGYYKYANFFVDTINVLAPVHLSLAAVVLPIGISFFTFTQIAFLVDTYQGQVSEPRFVPYLLFVTYFPHLIAGPVLHHAEMMPQFARSETFRFSVNNFVVGCGYFLIGLFKKVILADGIQPFVAPVFDAGLATAITPVEAWGGALAYTLQLYFDFSGYSDMAIGLSKMFNVDLPFNFNSPYRATSIIEFWRHWHMTLSRFLRDYLYIPLGGNRLGAARRHANLMTTMLLGGLWHGAGWTFVIWGGLHGLYLMVNHMFRTFWSNVLGFAPLGSRPVERLAGLLITFSCVVVAWVFFRASSLEAAVRVVGGMFELNAIVLPSEWQAFTGPAATERAWITYGPLQAFGGARQMTWTMVLLGIAWLLPNSQQVMNRFQSATVHLERHGENRGYVLIGLMAALACMLAVISGSRGYSEFIYFNF